MNTRLKTIFLALAACGFLASGASLAAPPNPSAEPGSQEPGPRGPGGNWEEFRAFKLEKLHQDLKLTAKQESAWNEWSGKIKAERPAWKERENLGNLTAPERMEKMLAFAKERVATLEERLAATKAFYAVLTPEQRQTFDKGFDFGPHGHGGRHWR